ncbi:ras-related protein Rab-39B-like protein [Leptotrombidium deliense]|uniref:Ras-related protein Rab-39B-like protein n=1 Tax=Leptotrombidium deliense TaxID=299467 RepID=A0A443SL90_9ACAR|nr:ras-related protein Rab-39B-like protein [Leptotrombidium deliense]
MIEAPFHYQFRLILIGDSTVGKSTLLKVFTTEGPFIETIDPTVGVDFFARIVDIKNNIKVKLQLWDTAGQEKFRSITRSYYRNSVGALLLYDVSKRASFDHLIDWLFEARRHIEPSGAVYQVVACKSDLETEREISTEEGQAFADFHNIKFIETSAKTMKNVDIAFKMIAEQIYDKLKAGKFKLSDEWDGIKVGHFGTNPLLSPSLTSNGNSRTNHRTSVASLFMKAEINN